MKAIVTMVWVLNGFEAVACIISWLYYKKLIGSIWEWLPFYLTFIICLEMLGRYFASDPALYKYNTWMYQYAGFPIQFIFFYFIFYKNRYFENKKKLVLAGCGLYLAGLIMDILLFNNVDFWFYSFSYTIGNIVLLILLLIFFYKFIQKEEILNFTRSMMFWFCLGLLVYYVGSLPFWALRNLLVTKYRTLFEGYFYVWLVLDYFMYLSFIIGIVWAKPK